MLYRFLTIIIGLICKILFRLEVTGHDNIPKSGGAIIASNHISLLDPPVLGVSMARHIHFMAKEELFRYPVFSWVITQLKAFPVRRGMADRVAIRTAISLLESGEIVGLFPEGTRSKTGVLGKPEQGLAMIAIKTGAPIIPAALIGTADLGNKLLPKFKVKFGKPIVIDKGKGNRETMDQISESMMREIALLIEEG
ncbi:1-acyl-sn-glycerol-3-phosphate acyltransferase [bioreactor metagenome]|uniref:1-acyl-sn-glycerol-3-phosphate acyltransferase n=1 Tax=bioreactor metagenome TaxID=1076179 RepID=A0A644T044_9ZZZZ|nr:lysophospholipid acyltransferase family protein [Negativicutes bacterium]